jgi:integrase
LFDHPYAYGTVEVTMSYVKRVMRRAHTDGWIAKDPTIGVRMPRRDSLDKSGKVTKDQVPTLDEALAIIAGAPLPYRAAVALGLGCGMRVGEVLGLTPSRVDLAGGKITIDRQYQRGRLDSPETWRGVRTFEPPDVVLTELRRVVRPGMAPDMPIFMGARGGTLRRGDFYSRAWRPALVAAGLESTRYKFHSARHFAVSNMLIRGVSVVEVAAFVGDSVGTITSVYAHFLRDSRSMAKLALDFALAGSAGEALRDNFATSD